MRPKISLDDIVQYLNKPHKYGRYYAACCPFHDDHSPSLLVYEDGFVCLSCRKAGRLDYLYEYVSGRRADQPRYVYKRQEEPEKSGVFPRDTHGQEKLCYRAANTLRNYYFHFGKYLSQRGISEEIAKQLLIGYYDDWYTFPVFDEYHMFKGMVGRATPALQEKYGMRYMTPHGQKPLLYQPLMKSSAILTVVYGIIDAIILAQAGIAACTPTAGKDSLRPEMLDWHRGIIIFIPDKGEIDTAIKQSSHLDWRGVIIDFDYDVGKKDVADYHDDLMPIARVIINKLQGMGIDNASNWQNVLSRDEKYKG
jgi:DNA primase